MRKPKFEVGSVIWFKEDRWGKDPEVRSGTVYGISANTGTRKVKDKSRTTTHISYTVRANGRRYYINIQEKDAFASREKVYAGIRNKKKTAAKASLRRAKNALARYEKQLIELNKQLAEVQK